MSLLRRLDLLDPFNYYRTTTTTNLAFPSPPLLIADDDDLLIADYLDLLPPKPTLFDSITDLLHPPSFRRIIRIEEEAPSLRRKMRLRSLRERVAELEAKFERVVADGKYTCTAEIEGEDVGRKYKWTAEVKGGKKKEEKWSAEVCEKKGKGKKYKWTSEVKGAEDCGGVGEYSGVKKEKGKKIKDGKMRIVEIEENGNGNGDANADDHHGALVLKQAFAKRSRASQNAKGKKKQLSPQDAAMMIQINFRAYLIRRSMALRALRELAVAKAKLKELRALFNNFSYRRRVAQDAEEHQKFSEKIIVLLLTVDAIEGSDVTVRGAKKSMIDELEAMLDVIDPQPCGKSLSMRRRTFDMPDGVIRKEIADGVAQVCQMLEGEENSSSTFEACL